ncbi:hypothetical protein [Caballeronia sordidicola]|uniref:hypothetical protein n=1 Tax=Caballeronia sordidicola TaxID=196367 RepID=UPI0004D026E2|nr:hypothetical protein [Caballeronia sordidicola]
MSLPNSRPGNLGESMHCAQGVSIVSSDEKVWTGAFAGTIKATGSETKAIVAAPKAGCTQAAL